MTPNSRPQSTYQFPPLSGFPTPSDSADPSNLQGNPFAPLRPSTAPITTPLAIRTRSRPDLRVNTHRESAGGRDNHPPVSMRSRPIRRISISSIGERVRSRSRSLLRRRRPSTSRHGIPTTTSGNGPLAVNGSVIGSSSRPMSSSPSAHASTSRSTTAATATRSGAEYPPHSRSSLGHAIRRASISLRDFVRDHAHIHHQSRPDDPHSEQRPHTAAPNSQPSAWNRLRQAASFRNTRSPMMNDYLRSLDTTTTAPLPSPTFPVPGHSGEPPIIPRKTGAAAKASAALQNEQLQRGIDPSAVMFHRTKQNARDKSAEEPSQDNESGIEIGVDHPDIDTTKIDKPDKRRDPVAYFPRELIIIIFGLLDPRESDVFRLVSRDWNFILSDPYIWREMLYSNFSQTYALSNRVIPDTGVGLPSQVIGNNWHDAAVAKAKIDINWKTAVPEDVLTLLGHQDSIYCLQFDEYKIITGSRDRTIRVWDMETYECRFVIGPTGIMNPTQLYTPDGDLAHCVVRWDPDSGIEKAMGHSVPQLIAYPNAHQASILCLQYDDEVLVTGSSDNTIIVYDMKTQFKPMARLVGHSAAVLDICFDKKYIVSCSKDCSVIVWNRKTKQSFRILTGHSGPVNSVQMRGTRIISCSGDCTVKLWDLMTGECLQTFRGHTKGLACSQFSEDGKFIISAGNDRDIRIWNAETGDAISSYGGHSSLVRSLHLDSISGRLISGSYDTSIRIHDLNAGGSVVSIERVHDSWVLSTQSDYRRMISTGQIPKIHVMDFGAATKGANLLRSPPKVKLW